LLKPCFKKKSKNKKINQINQKNQKNIDNKKKFMHASIGVRIRIYAVFKMGIKCDLKKNKKKFKKKLTKENDYVIT